MDSNRLIIGIDPGLHGAIALINEKNQVISLQDTPIVAIKKGRKTRHVYVPDQMVVLLENAKSLSNLGKAMNASARPEISAFLENVHSMPGQGVRSMFGMGEGLGLWRGMFHALHIPVTMIEPMKWKRIQNLVGAPKSAACKVAKRAFPKADLMKSARHRVPSDGRADALLIALSGLTILNENAVSQKPTKSKRKVR